MAIAVIGAGMAGLSAARALAAQGKRVLVFDKGRGPGGRMSTRRAETPIGQMRFDHGAQFFTARDEAFRAEVDGWIEAGAVAQWEGVFKRIDIGSDGSLVASGENSDERQHLVGTPTMNAVIRHMSDGLDVSWGRRVSGVSGGAGDLWLTFEDGAREGAFEAVVVAVPAEQASELLEKTSPTAARAAAASGSAPCWAVMAAFEAPVDLSFDGARVSGSPLAWIARLVSG